MIHLRKWTHTIIACGIPYGANYWFYTAFIILNNLHNYKGKVHYLVLKNQGLKEVVDALTNTF